MDVYFAKFNQNKRRGELILMNSRNHVHKSAVEAGKQAGRIIGVFVFHFGRFVSLAAQSELPDASLQQIRANSIILSWRILGGNSDKLREESGHLLLTLLQPG